MTADQIIRLGPALAKYLDEFADCFVRAEPREHLSHYVRGQLSGLQRKSVEPMALLNGVAPRTLQEFLRSDVWDHPRARDRVQQIVARDHEDPKAIGIIDDSGHPKSGKKTPGVQWQYCGRLGKTANCVVTVQLAFSSYDTRFRTMLDTELFLPESWSNDRERCRKAGIPDHVVYRPKHHIALELLDRAAGNGVHLEWVTADIWYSEKPDFLAGLEQRNHRYVVEIPRNLHGWLYNPGAEPRHRARGVAELCHHARQMTRKSGLPSTSRTRKKDQWSGRPSRLLSGYTGADKSSTVTISSGLTIRCPRKKKNGSSSGIPWKTNSKPGCMSVSRAGPSNEPWRTRKANWDYRISKSASIKP
jgi:SRSO17 transposase